MMSSHPGIIGVRSVPFAHRAIPFGELTQTSIRSKSMSTSLERRSSEDRSPVCAQRAIAAFAAASHQGSSSLYWQDQVTACRDSLQRVTLHYYDCLGREIKTTYPGGSYTSASYDDRNRTTTSKDEFGHKTVKTYDNLGQLNRTQEYNYTRTFETRTAYDAVGNLVTVRASNGQVTRMTYDTLNRLTRTTYDDGLSDQATYDDSGRIISQADRSSNIRTSLYDSAGNVRKSLSASDIISNSYDCAGQKVRTSNSLGSTSYTYDKCGRLKYLNESVMATYSLMFTYDAIGNLKSIKYPDTKIVTFDYDAYGRMKNANRTTNNSLTLLQLAYNKDNSVSMETFGSSMLTTTYTYNPRNWPITVVTVKGSKTKLSLAYSYYLDGNVRYLATSDGSTLRNESYCCDQLERLTRGITNASGSWGTITYGYDSVGNRLWKNEGGTNTTYLYCSYNQLNKTTAGSTTWWYNYDRNGNLIWKNGTTLRYHYVFNSLNQLTQAINWTKSGSTWSSSVAATYYYDANGARAKVSVGTITSEYIYLGHDPLFEKTGTLKTDYVYMNRELKAKLSGTTTDAYYYLLDPVGSVWQVWKNGGSSAVFSVKSYKPFGTPIINTQTTTEKFRFANEIQDAPTSLYYIFERWMDPELGRFLSLDPKTQDPDAPQLLNRYVYCASNPLRFTDPTGKYPADTLGGAVIGLYTGMYGYLHDWEGKCIGWNNLGTTKGVMPCFDPIEFFVDTIAGGLGGYCGAALIDTAISSVNPEAEILNLLCNAGVGVWFDINAVLFYRACKEIQTKQPCDMKLDLVETAISNFLDSLMPGLGAVADDIAKDITPEDWRHFDAGLTSWLGDIWDRVLNWNGRVDLGLSTTPNLEYLGYMNAGCPGMYVYTSSYGRGGGPGKYI